ncbi:MAG: DUF5683 domain-containing protein [Paludibacter sp.]|nr:DUF5683 domain-containing protein [Paludibacter sp.]
MFQKIHLILCFLFVLIFFFINNIDAQTFTPAQSIASAPSDSVIIVPTTPDSVLLHTDSSIFVLQNNKNKLPDTLRFNGVDANKVVWFGAIVPGMGQILNRKYWKLPIVYGGFLVCAYAITWNGTQYNSYKNAYRDIIDNNPNTNSYLDLLPKGYTIENYPGGINNLTQRLKSGQDNYRRYRDLSVLISVLYYGLTVLDAYVDAQLFNFDISPDLSMRVNPAVINSAQIQSKKNSNAFGVQLSLNF